MTVNTEVNTFLIGKLKVYMWNRLGGGGGGGGGGHSGPGPPKTVLERAPIHVF